MKKLNVLFFIILPLVLFYIGMLLHSETIYYHLYSTDPGYAYLFDGLNICNLSTPFIVIGPNTPLSLVCAAVMKMVHLFRQEDSLIIDVMKNPDIYLSAINITIIAIQSILLFLIGLIIFKSSKSIITGIFFQLTPFVSWIFIDLLRPIMAENLIVIGVFLLIILIYKYNYDQDNHSKLVDKYLIGFSIVIGFIAATKLMYLPIAIIPFLLINGFKKKGLYIIFSVISFCVFAFPIFNDWVTFRNYYLDNFLHSGQYGNGPKNIVALNIFIPNLKSIFTSDHFYLKSFSIIIIGSILYYLPFLKVKRENDKAYKTLLGIAITMIIMTLLVAKQFKFYYMTTALLLSIPGIYFVFSIFTRNITKKIRTIIAIPAILIVAYFLYHETKMRIDWHPGNMVKTETYLKTMQFIDNKYSKDQPTLLIPNYYGAPYKEYGCFYGMAWCRGEMREVYAKELKILYPNIYFYHSWNNLFNYWDNSFSYIDLLKRYKNIVLFSGDTELEKSLYSKLHGLNRQIDTRITKIKTFETTGETIYEVSYDSTLAANPYSILFDAETLDSSKQNFINSQGLMTENGITQSSEYARSGINCTKLTKENPYGMTASISEVQKGEHYRVSIWMHNNGNINAGLVIAAQDVNKYYSFTTQPSIIENDWQKIEFDFIVPESAYLQDIKIYCWNNDNILPAYFDDLIIEKIPD